MKTLIKNGRVFDSKNGLAGKNDILIEGNKIFEINKEIKNQDYEVIDAEGKIIIPALIDIHTHLREPGFEEKETVKTGCEAAAAGGFSAVAAMPNTKPIADNPAVVEHLKLKSEKAAVRVYPIGSITQDSKGEVLSEIGTLAKTGVKALSDDGNPVMNSEIMRRAMEYASAFDLPIIDHCEDKNLSQDGVMHEGYYSTIFGLKGIPAAAEEIMVARDIVLAEMTGIHLHIAHLSTEGSLNLVKEAKSRGVNVTFEVTPHHLLLTDKEVGDYNPDTKVHPPLRSERDKNILVEALKAGEIDVLTTDHAPHTFEDKLGEFDYAAFGISGLETVLSLLYHNFIKTKIIDWDDLLRMYYYNPGKILNIESEGLKQGARADLLIFDPEREWTVDKNKFKSKGKNTPFAGQKLSGKNELTFVGGKLVYDDRGGKNEILY
ncbi:dihydroorotase [Halanaerobium saccharolyticum]|uniref:Dihydroorotase n=1 Tax=Halanaerobium saccharolyticum TaxID=43595 RepID=A0A4R7Z644_9FIRM|nr:dihydroorotase [Halanaerobium saccharolyticum]RAK10533.1 dihydroorotase [Halanaerobium saccharolyticum]TDW06710.1 dihydroorotase [Halanaerobium saccharolyticum]TDX62345.1 dihydroorotase [Halanaerobium saccharolyticum]